MALSRKQWNNIIIFACLFMVAMLTFMNNQTQNIPSDTKRLFDDNAPLAQLQLNNLWLRKQASAWTCAPEVLNCEEWAHAWQTVQISPLATARAGDNPLEIIIQIVDIPDPQRWLYFPLEGTLKSPAGHWYQVPPSLRDQLQPILNAKPAVNAEPPA
ncbi:MAG: hypothetical protein ACRCVV_07805 [Shewanella sp.]